MASRVGSGAHFRPVGDRRQASGQARSGRGADPQLGLTERCSMRRARRSRYPGGRIVDFVYIRLRSKHRGPGGGAAREAGHILRPGGWCWLRAPAEPEGLRLSWPAPAQTSVGATRQRALLPSLVTTGFDAARVDIATTAAKTSHSRSARPRGRNERLAPGQDVARGRVEGDR